MTCSYPNLELLEYIFKQKIYNEEKFKKVYKEKNEQGYVFYEISADVFKQTWENTSCGFDTIDGKPTLSGQAFTSAYTTVFHESLTDSYGVFFDNRFCYLVTDPTEQFFSDLKDRRLEPYSVAKEKY